MDVLHLKISMDKTWTFTEISDRKMGTNIFRLVCFGFGAPCVVAIYVSTQGLGGHEAKHEWVNELDVSNRTR